jgi:uncharacterized protein
MRRNASLLRFLRLLRLRRVASGLALLVTVLALAAAARADGFRVPPLRGPVNDTAGMLSAEARRNLESALRALHEEGGTQLAILTLPSLSGLSIEQASIRVVDQWKLGTEKQDDGILLLIAREEREMRIEVGQGLEGVVTDAYARRIIDEDMVPLFRAGDVDSGVILGVFQIARLTDPEVDLRPHLEGSLHLRTAGQHRSRGQGAIPIFGLLVLLPLMVMRMGLFGSVPYYRRRRGYYWGGGGFGGGGGGFSGGGASGGW